MVLPLLLRVATSSIVKSTAKNAVKGAVKSKAKDFIRGKSKKKSSAIVKEGASKTEVRPISSALVPIKKIDEKPDIVDTPTKSKVSKTESRTDVIEKQLNNIVNLTSTLNSLVLSQYNQKKKTEEKRRKKLEKEKKRKREEEQETEKPGSGIVGGAVSKAKQFNIFDALLNFFLGAGLLRLISFLKGNVDENGKPKGLFKSLSEGLGNVRNLFYGFKLAKAALGSLVNAIGRGFKAIPNLFKSVVGIATKAVKGIGGSLVKGFKGLLGGNGKIFTFFKGIVDKAKKLASAAARLSGIDTRTDDVKNARKRLKELEKLRKLDSQISRTLSKPGVSRVGDLGRTLGDSKSGYRSPDRYRAPGQARAGGFQLEQARKARQALSQTAQPTVPKAGNLAGGIKGSSLTSRGLKNVPGRLATRVIGRGGRETLRGVSRTVSPALKFGKRALSRAPLIGPLLVALETYFEDADGDGEPDRNLTKTFFTSIGSFAGGALGAALVGGATVGFGAILGGIVGEYIGKYLGELLYIAFKGGGVGEVGKKIKEDMTNALTEGAKYARMIKDWAKKGFGRLYESLPKTSFYIPFNPFGINDMEFLEPNLIKIIFSAVMNIPKAFFSDDPMKPGEVDKKDDKKNNKKNENVKRKVGTKAILGGKPVIWAGDNYGWQSPESYKKLYPSETPSGPTSSGRSPQGYNSTLMPSSKASNLYSKLRITASQWKTYKDTLASIETSGFSLKESYRVIGGTDQRHDGRYQMGEDSKKDAARILGIPVPSREQFRNDAQLQEDMFLAYTAANDGYLSGPRGSTRYKKSGGIERLTYLGFAHNQGWANAANWLDSNMTKDPTRDGFGTSGTEFTKALRKAFGSQSSTTQQTLLTPSSTSSPNPTQGPTNLLNIFARAGSTQAQQIQSQLTPQQAQPSTPPVPQQTPLTPPVPQQPQLGSTGQNLPGIIKKKGSTTGTNYDDLISGFPVTSPYRSPRRPDHKGIDIGTPVGTYVALDVDVEIVFAGLHGRGPGNGYGNVVDAWAPSLGLQFRLAHLNKILVRKGQRIPAGVPLGQTGGAKGDVGRGSSSGPHLHFEVDNKKDGTNYGGMGNPSPYVGHLILSSSPPTGQTPGGTSQVVPPTQPPAQVRPPAQLPAQVVPPAQVTPRGTSQNTEVLEQYAEYENGGEENVVVPIPVGGGGSPVIIGGGGEQVPLITPGGSPETMVNNWWRVQLLGFLYKQG